jgi:F-type H+-transporting ATPase subunit epsilon
MELEIITPDRKVFKGTAESVQLPGSDGYFEILNSHAPLIASLGSGTIKVKEMDKSSLNFTVNGGIVEVLNNQVIVLAEQITA